MKKICIVGMGNMGQAMWNILKKNSEFELIGCDKTDDVNKKLEQAEVIIIAVKPQVFGELAAKISVDLSEKIVISIMAGFEIKKIQEAMKTKKVVRAFPSMPLKVGQSLTIWKADKSISAAEKSEIKEMLIAFGQEIEVDVEEKINTIGIVSGCGPGFLGYFGEKMAGFLVAHGIDKVEAEKVARQTLIGTGAVMSASNWNSTEMRAKVSSKGGLTEAGTKMMEENGIEEIFWKGIEAAMKRNEELSK